MEILHPNRQKDWIDQSSGNKANIEKLILLKQEEIHELSAMHEIVFVMQGEITYWTGRNEEVIATKGEAVFFPSEQISRLLANECTTLLFFRLYDKLGECGHYFLAGPLYQEDNRGEGTGENLPFHLQVNPILDSYLKLLDVCYETGLRGKEFFEAKTKELFCMLRAFYTKEEYRLFFHPALIPDSSFSQFIIQNHRKYKTMSRLADAMSYTASGFEKRFKKVFKQSPYRWMKEQKAREIYHIIRISDHNFKEISENFGFNSTSQFNDFVKGYFGKTPGEIRKNRQFGTNAE